MNKKLLLGMGISALKEFYDETGKFTGNKPQITLQATDAARFLGAGGTGGGRVGAGPFNPAKGVAGLFGATLAAAGGIVSGVFRGKEEDLIDDLVVSPRSPDGRLELARRLRDTLQVSPRSQAGQSEVARRNQDRQDRKRRRRTSRELSVYFTLSIAALLAAGFTVAQASKFVKKVRANLRGRKASFDIVKLASMGDTEGAQMLLDKEFGKTGIDMNKVAGAVEGVSNRELRIAARVLKKEIGS